MTWPFAAVSTKYGLPFDDVRRSKRPSFAQFFRTDSMPFIAPDFAL
jgi:hypothetical protein